MLQLSKIIKGSKVEKRSWIESNIDLEQYGAKKLANICKNKPDIIPELCLHPEIDINKEIEAGLGGSILMEFCDKNIELMPELLKHPNINPNIKNSHGRTPLIEICGNKIKSKNLDDKSIENQKKYQQKAVNALINHPDIDVNLQDQWSKTALIVASQKNPDLVPELLTHPDIKIDIRDNWNQTPLKFAFDPNQEIIIDLIQNLPFKEIYKYSKIAKNYNNGSYEKIQQAIKQIKQEEKEQIIQDLSLDQSNKENENKRGDQEGQKML